DPTGATDHATNAFGSPEIIDRFCTNPSYPQPPNATWPYKSFGQAGTPLSLDEFDLANAGPLTKAPALVILHGGGWATGCRWSIDAKAATLAGSNPSVVLPQNFITFSIDYRLSCNPLDPGIPANSPIKPLCGWDFDHPDSGLDGISDGPA